MAKRVGLLFWLVLGILLALIIFEDSASAYKIVWKRTGGDGYHRTECTYKDSGEVSTSETSMTPMATYQAYTAIFGTTEITYSYGGCVVYTDDCDNIKESWEAKACDNGIWRCIAGYKDCDHTDGVGTWAVIAADSCGDGYCTGSETQCSCPNDCGISPTPCCVCSTGPCCDGCNYRPSGSNCGTAAACHYDYYYQSSGSCYKADYPTSCTKTCDGSGNCQDCCIPVNSLQTWDCGICQQKNLSSCSGSTGPLCENSPPGTLCNSDSNSCTNDICYSGACTHPAFCPGTDISCGCTSCSNCNSQDRYYDTSPLVTKWVSTGECTEKEQKQEVYRDYYCYGTNCAYTSGTTQWADTGSTRSKAGTQCTTTLGYPGTCDSSGTCIPKPLLTLSAGLSTSTIKVNEQSVLTGNVICSNANCGNIWVYAKNTSGISINLIPGLNVQGSNPYDCTYMYAGGFPCSPSWTITGVSPGSYEMQLIASNGSSFTNTSNSVTLSVIQIPTGGISASISLDSSTITVATATVARASISCSGSSGAYCGSITSYLSYNDSWGLSVMPGTSQSCAELWNGQTCYVNWTINSTRAGTYNVSVTASSNKTGVSNAGAYKTLSVNERPVGVLQIQNLYLRPPSQKIIIGENAFLGAEIKCKSSDNSSYVSCGSVKSYARQNGMKIIESGPLSVTNPEISCGPMYSTPPYNMCYVNWSIRGNSAGSYLLDIAANSGSSEVQNVTSDIKPTLTVSKNLGMLSIPKAEFSPREINLTNPAILAATVNCSTNYCGSVIVQPTISPATGLAGDQSPKNCYSFPCDLSWSMIGSSEGSFYVAITAASNESIQPASNTTTLVVKGPNPFLGIVSNLFEIKNAKAGQPVQIRATVTCYTKGCGQTLVSLAQNSNGWNKIPYGKIYFTPYNQQNPVSIEMPAGQSSEIVWTVSFAEAGTYEIGIFANGSAANVINAGQTETITVGNVVGNIEILSPKANERFSRGDIVFLKVRITLDGKPAAGLSPFMPQLGASLYDDGNHSDDYANDGIYGGGGRIPSDASGEYELTFRAGEYEASAYVYINPVLYVTLSTDKTSYSGGDKIRITGEVKKNEAATDAMVTLTLSHSSGSWSKEIKLNASGFYSSEVTAPNIDGKIKITVNAQDSYMNSGQNQTEVSVTARMGNLYNISFALSKYNYSRGENVPITLKVTDMDVPQTGIKVKCNFFGNIELNENKKIAGFYYGSHTIPFDATIREESLACDAFGDKSGTGFVNIKIEPMLLKISVVSPQPYQNVLPVVSNQPVELKIAVFYPDNTPVMDAVVQLGLGNETKNLTYSGIPGIYTTDARFRKQASGAAISSIFLTAQDSQGNYGENNVTIAVDTGEFNWWWLLLIPAGMAILFFVWYYMKSKEPPKIQIQEKIIKLPTVERIREIVYRPVRMPAPAKPRVDPIMKLKDEIDRLQEKSRTTQDAKDLAEQQYYKRQIDEATFNKLMQSYEEKLIEIDATIRQKKKELYEMEPD